MAQLERIFFDIDDTLYSTTDFTKTARSNSIEALLDIGLNISREDLEKELNEVTEEFPSNYPRHYNKLLLRLPDEVLGPINPAIAVAAAVMAYHRTKHEQFYPFPDAEKLLTSLTGNSMLHPSGVVTEGLSVKQAEKLLRLDLYSYFDPEAIFISEQVGISKPNPKLFQRVLKETGHDASKTMYVGDKPGNDIDPANEVGMITVHVDKETRHTGKTGETRPDYQITHYRELYELLVEEYKLHLEWS